LTGIYRSVTVAGMNATTFAALGEPSRLQIVELLRLGPRSVGEIADDLGIRQPQASKHLGVLRRSEIVDVGPVGRRRIYHLRAEPFEELGAWLDTFERQWEARLDALGAVLDTTDENEER